MGRSRSGRSAGTRARATAGRCQTKRRKGDSTAPRTQFPLGAPAAPPPSGPALRNGLSSSGREKPATPLSGATGATRGREVPAPNSGRGVKKALEDRNPAPAVAGPSHPPGRRKKLQLSLERGGAGLLKGPHSAPGSLVWDCDTPRTVLGAKALRHCRDALPG